MTYLSIIEKLRILFDMLLDFKFILVFVILLFVLTIIYIFKKISTKRYILMMVGLLVLLLLISIISNYKILFNTFDNFTTIFFSNIYFPSIYVYIAMLLVNFVVFIISLFSIIQKKVYKIINSIIYVLNSILFVIVLNIIAKNKIDIFSVSSLYTNTGLVAILEISMNLFIVWLFSLVIIYTTNSICDWITYKKESKNSNYVVQNDNVIYTNEVLNSYEVKEDNVVTTPLVCNVVDPLASVALETKPIKEEANMLVNVTPNTIVTSLKENTKKENKRNKKSKNTVSFEDILNGNLPVKYYKNNINNNMDYEIMNPQAVYEEKYNSKLEIAKDEVSFQDITNIIDDPFVGRMESVEESSLDMTPSIEDITLEEKKKNSKERLLANTVSLNDLINEENTVIENTILIDNKDDNICKERDVKTNYTLEDYKKFIKMLNSLKSHFNKTNITIDDAIAISLIGDYSIDDCVMFKDILESNLV